MEKIGKNVFAAVVTDIGKATQLIDECDGYNVNDIKMKVELSSMENDG